MNIRPALISALILALCLLAGCGYRLGPTGGRAAGARSLEIAPFRNETREARVLDALSTALRRRTQADGTFKLATRRDGDLILSGVVTEYRRRELSFEPGDLATVRDYQLVMTAQATVVERATGRVIFDGETTGQTTIRVGPDLASAERQALPLLADDLARNLIGKLADGDW